MLKIFVAAMLLAGLDVVAFEARAEETCLSLGTYTKLVAEASDKDLATLIRCRTEMLPDDVTKATSADMEAVGQIMLIASKIIGNGHASSVLVSNNSGRLAYVKIPDNGVVSDTEIDYSADNPRVGRNNAGQVPSENVQDAMIVMGEASVLLDKMVWKSAFGSKCSTAAGSKDAILWRVSKIIGNG